MYTQVRSSYPYIYYNQENVLTVVKDYHNITKVFQAENESVHSGLCNVRVVQNVLENVNNINCKDVINLLQHIYTVHCCAKFDVLVCSSM